MQAPTPSAVHVGGGTLVQIVANLTFESIAYECDFVNATVPARYVGDNTLECVVPGVFQPVTFNITLLHDGLQYTTNKQELRWAGTCL